MLAFIALLLGNPQEVEVYLLVYPIKMPVFYLISLAATFGIVITFLFLSLLSRDKKLKAKLKKAQGEQKAEKKAKAQEQKNKKLLSQDKSQKEEDKKNKVDEKYKSPFY